MANKDFKVKNGIDIQSPLPVSMGGTGQTSSTNTLNSLLPSQTGNANKVLQTDGTNTTWYTVPAAYTRGGMAGRPVSPTAGDLYFNTDKKAFEVWTGSAWVSVAVNGAVPLAPTIGTATVSGLTASVPFTGPTDFGDAAITSYTATSNPGGITGSNASSPISVSGLSQATSYTFTVTATNSYGTSNESSASNSITTASVPGAPTSVTAVDQGIDGYATVSWLAPASNGGSAITDYIVQYSSDSGSSWTTFSDGTSTDTSATVSGLITGIAYIFRIAAVNLVGTGSYSTASASFTPPSHESMIAIQTVTVTSAGGVSTITFSNIPSTYAHLQIRGFYTSTYNNLMNTYARLNSDTGANYTQHSLYGDGGSAGSDGTANTDHLRVGFSINNSANPSTFICDILDYANTNKFKTMRSLMGQDSNGTGWILSRSGLWRSNSAVTSISLFPQVGTETFKQYSQFTLYGVAA